jgi:hypothetical protein
MVFSNRNFNDNIQSSDKSLDYLFLGFSVRITKIILLVIFHLVLFYYEILIPTVIYVTLVNKSYKFSLKVESKNNYLFNCIFFLYDGEFSIIKSLNL